jgi:hypothetical protein
MDDIFAMAREAGGLGYVHDAGDDPHKWQFTVTELQAFVALVRADEKEACAKVCDGLNFIENGTPAGTRTSNRHCAAAIRARNKE